jgi:prepilin-type processing-associated H-X9-DG protein
MYIQDYDETCFNHANMNCIWYPPVNPTGLPTVNDMVWPILMYPYVNNVEVFNCPSASRRWDGRISVTISYGFNDECSCLPIARMNYPSELCMFADSIAPYVSPTFASRGPENGRGDMALDRHNEGLNVGFADGHAKWFQGSNVPDDSYDGSDSSTMTRFWDPNCP